MEAELIRWLKSRVRPHPQVPLGIGDDAALLSSDDQHEWVVTTDMLMDGVDFHLAEVDPRRIGRKALAVNLSDLAAMAAKPVAAFVSLALPRNGAFDLAKQLYDGMMPLAEQFDTTIAGGDTNTWDGPLVISVTVMGTVRKGCAWRRDGALPGDKIVVTGEFGGSILGRHFDFEPRVNEASKLSKSYDIHAAIDVSDGLSLDLSRLAESSNCGALLYSEHIPISADGNSAAASPRGRTPLERALGDGEDFELILAMSAGDAERLVAEQPFLEHGVPLTVIGRFVPEPGLWLRDETGKRLAVTPRGYLHEST